MRASAVRAGVALMVTALLAWPAAPLAQTAPINGAGATFPYPIYSAWAGRHDCRHSPFTCCSYALPSRLR
jgi:hypothetical protein